MPEKEHIPDKSIERIHAAMIIHAREIATEINATAVLAYVDAIQSERNLESLQGLGARHRAALGITALTDAPAVTISESNGDVRVFSKGKVFMEIEKRRKTESY